MLVIGARTPFRTTCSEPCLRQFWGALGPRRRNPQTEVSPCVLRQPNRSLYLAGAQAAATAADMSVTQASGEAPLKLLLVVAVALIDSQDRVLLAQRPPGKALQGLWEFPGGKVEANESPEHALVRELEEELSIQVQAQHLKPLTFASHRYERFHLLMPLYECRTWRGVPQAQEGQNLAWATAGQLQDFEMPPADVPLIPHIVRALSEQPLSQQKETDG